MNAPARIPATSSRPRRWTASLRALGAEDERGMRDGAMIRLMISCGLSEIELIRADMRDLKGLSGQTILWSRGRVHTTKDQVVFLPEAPVRPWRYYLAGRPEATAGGPAVRQRREPDTRRTDDDPRGPRPGQRLSGAGRDQTGRAENG